MDTTSNYGEKYVAPFTGAWIEMYDRATVQQAEQVSLPSRERGLKSSTAACVRLQAPVAPFTGAWIEII